MTVILLIMRSNSQISNKGNDMNEINIISSDARYVALNDIFLEHGYKSRVCTFDAVQGADVLILPIKSALADEDFSRIFRGIEKRTLVFSGEINRVKKYFDGKIIDYSNNEWFLEKNAYITAECALSIALKDLQKTISNSKCAIVGYGRIGKHLAKLLKSLSAFVTVVARREESRQHAQSLGYESAEITDFLMNDFDVIFNTVPTNVITKNMSDKIPKRTLVYDLASMPGGFEDEKFPIRALGLPGKMMPISAAEAIFDFVESYISIESE